ncbi:MAG: hypothetical protein AB7F74_21595 [Parvibaculaceae bacterium]
MNIRSLLPNDCYLEACGETSNAADALDALLTTPGLDPATRGTLAEELQSTLESKADRETMAHPTSWVGRVYKLYQAKVACSEGTDIADTALYLAGELDELIRSLPQQVTLQWLNHAISLRDRLAFVFDPDEYCCQCLASVIAGAMPANDNRHLRSV